MINKLMMKVELFSTVKQVASEYYINYNTLRISLRKKGLYYTDTLWISWRKVHRLTRGGDEVEFRGGRSELTGKYEGMERR